MREQGFGNSQEDKKKIVGEAVNRKKVKPKHLDNIIGQRTDLNGSLRMVHISDIRRAPDEWNFFSPLTPQKYYELVESVLDHGIMTPGTMWEKPEEDTSMMALAGHNRHEVLQLIYEATGDEEYAYFPCLVKAENELTEEEAREFVIDTNWVSRDLTTMDKAKAIYHKYILLGGKRNSRGAGRIDKSIADQYKIGRQQVNDLRSLVDCISDFHPMLDSGELSISAMAYVAKFSIEIQSYIFRNYVHSIKVDAMKRIKANLKTIDENDIDGVRRIIDDEMTKDRSMFKVGFKIDKSVDNRTKDMLKSLSNEEKEIIEEKVKNLVINWIREYKSN